MTAEAIHAAFVIIGVATLFNVALTISILRLYVKIMHKRHELETSLAEVHHLRGIAMQAMARSP